MYNRKLVSSAFLLIVLLLSVLGASVNAQSGSPIPKITSIVFTKTASIRETVSIALSVQNQGSQASLGIISIAFPGNPDPSLICNPNCVSNAPNGWQKYPPGSQLACCGGTISARYTDVEANSGGEWNGGQTYSFVVFVKVMSSGNFTFDAKSAMQGDSGWVADPLTSCSSCPVDQQQEPVYRYTISVASNNSSNFIATTTTATPTNSSSTQSSSSSSPSYFQNPVTAAEIAIGVGIALVGTAAIAFSFRRKA